MIRLRKPVVDQTDLQGNVLCAYGNDFLHGLYLFVRIDGAPGGRRLLAALRPDVTDAVPWPEGQRPSQTLNVALSWRGFQALGVPRRLLETFPDEFRQGMAARADLLGDTGRSAPVRWDCGLTAGEPHLLITLTARRREQLIERWEQLRDLVGPGSGLTPVHEVEAGLLEHPGDRLYAREHFGFADGLAQPAIRGNAGPSTRRGGGTPTRWGWRELAPGEFVLGYRDEDGVMPVAPAAPLGRSGSYVVVRKLHQDVACFTRYLRDAAQGDPEREAFLAAKMVGRWRDGTPLALSGEPGGIQYGGGRGEWINDFRYAHDPHGLHCPLGAHIRRANPRDALGWEGRLTKRHRIIRRGMPYGPPPADPAVDDGRDRGLMFVCYQASIARQFETIQQHWLMDGDAFGLGADRDSLTGADPAGKMTIQGRPPLFLHPQPAFVTTRGGEYYFTPGIAALEALAAGRFG